MAVLTGAVVRRDPASGPASDWASLLPELLVPIFEKNAAGASPLHATTVCSKWLRATLPVRRRAFAGREHTVRTMVSVINRGGSVLVNPTPAKGGSPLRADEEDEYARAVRAIAKGPLVRREMVAAILSEIPLDRRSPARYFRFVGSVAELLGGFRALSGASRAALLRSMRPGLFSGEERPVAMQQAARLLAEWHGGFLGAVPACVWDGILPGLGSRVGDVGDAVRAAGLEWPR